MKFLVFHNAADDSYINTVENFRGAYASTETVDIYFNAAGTGLANGFDKITVACTNGEEDRAVEELCNAMTRNASVITIADDVNSVYACQNITSVTSISLAAVGTFMPVESVTDAKALGVSDSGKILTLDDAAGFTLTLPAVATAGAGWNCKVIVGTNCTSNSYIITELTSSDTDVLVTQINELETDDTEDGPSSTGHTTITLGNALDTVGDTFDIVCNGSKFFIQGTVKLDGGAALA
mgnify:CR=1 FL=1